MAKNIPSCDAPGSLHLRTLALLKADKRDHVTISTETKVPYHWLKKFMEGKHSGSVNRVQFLYEQLSGKKLSV